MPTPREGGAAALAADNKIYVVGGNGSGLVDHTVEAYDPATDTWTVKAPVPIGSTYMSLVAAPNGKLYALGSDTSGTVQEYDPATNTWANGTPLNIGRDYLGATLAGNGRIYALGGRIQDSGNVLSNANEEGRFGQAGYVFSGFQQPVDNDAVNIAKAGQTVPVRWRLLDADGNLVSDPASFVSLTSSPASTACSGGPSDAIESYSGGSGLQYLGDGNWQFNWKTPKSYAGQCRTMSVNFSDGSSHRATFQFN